MKKKESILMAIGLFLILGFVFYKYLNRNKLTAEQQSIFQKSSESLVSRKNQPVQLPVEEKNSNLSPTPTPVLVE